MQIIRRPHMVLMQISRGKKWPVVKIVEGFIKPAYRRAYLNGQKAFEKIKFFTSSPGNQNSELLFHTSYLLGKKVCQHHILGTLIFCWWWYKSVQSIQRASWDYLIKTFITHGLAIPFLSILPRGTCKGAQGDMYKDVQCIIYNNKKLEAVHMCNNWESRLYTCFFFPHSRILNGLHLCLEVDD